MGAQDQVLIALGAQGAHQRGADQAAMAGDVNFGIERDRHGGSREME